MDTLLISEAVKCYHCSDDCKDTSIHIDDKNFCCEGCKTVYEILQDNNLCTYYDIDANPGLKIKTRSDERYAYLDKPEIVSSLIDFRNDGIATINLYIPSIHCSSCIWLLEKLYKIEPGINRSDVSFTKKEIAITYQESIISLRRIVEMLDSLGYAPRIQLDKTSKKEAPKTDRSVFYKMGLAGFCASNIMLMSFPEYLGLDKLAEQQYSQVFGYISIALGLPVLLYSASDFYLSAWAGLKNKIINLELPIAIGMTALFSRSVYEIISHTGAGYLDSFTGLVFFLLIGKWYQGKIYQALSFERDYQSYFPVAVTRVFKGIQEPVLINDLEPGDEICIRSQEIIPADSILLSDTAYIDYSFVTGESIPVKKVKGDLIYAGGRQTREKINLRIEKEVSQSHLLQLWNKKVFTKETPLSGVSAIANSFGRNFTIGLLVISLLTFLYWSFISVSAAFTAVTAVLIVACPCALALSIPFAYGNAIRILAKHGLFLRGADIVEKIAKIDTIVFDKTGTITKMDEASIQFEGDPLSTEEYSMIHSIVVHSTHPLSVKLARYLSGYSVINSIQNFIEIPSKGLSAIINGIEVKVGSPSFTNAPVLKESLTSRVCLSINNTFRGYFIIQNVYRKDLDTLVSSLALNNSLYVVSGDNTSEKEYLSTVFPNSDHLVFNQSPEDKLAFISNLQSNGANVMMLGDGLNDAGELKQSNVGISISDDVYNFSPSCDGILEASKISVLNKVISFCKGTVKAVKATLVFSLLYNAVVISLAVKGLFTPMVAAIIMPVSSVTVVLIVILSTNFLARRFN